MKNFKDFFYEKNDIIIAIIILLVAAGLIFWRVDAIMQYPETLAKETHTVETSSKNPEEAEKKEKAEEKKKGEEKNEESPKTEKSSDSLWTSDGTLTKKVDVTVESGTVTEAVDCLVKAGLFSSYDDFAKSCESVGATPDNIKAQAYTFDKGTSKGDIATRVTQ